MEPCWPPKTPLRVLSPNKARRLNRATWYCGMSFAEGIRIPSFGHRPLQCLVGLLNASIGLRSLVALLAFSADGTLAAYPTLRPCGPTSLLRRSEYCISCDSVYSHTSQPMSGWRCRRFCLPCSKIRPVDGKSLSSLLVA